MLARPWRLPEALWAVLGALLLVSFSLLPLTDAWHAVAKGTDVYAFLLGMMLLAELARHAGLFDWVAAQAVTRAAGSPTRLFAIVYLAGTAVTIFLSNDATAVVLTPAVYAAAKRARAKPLPYLFACALVANAASFVLPISNPANLVIYGTRMPTLGHWLGQFSLPSLVALIATYGVLYLTQRDAMTDAISREATPPVLQRGGRLAAAGIAFTGAVLLIASILDYPLGLPTLVAAVITATAICAATGLKPQPIVRDIAWSVIPLVAGLFVLVKGIELTAVFSSVVQILTGAARTAPQTTALWVGTAAAVGSNVTNNLPLGLIAGTAAEQAHLTPRVAGSLLIGIDLGPNLSVTGSLATLLWLVALRREGEQVSAARFFRVGMWVMPPALIASLAAFMWVA